MLACALGILLQKHQQPMPPAMEVPPPRLPPLTPQEQLGLISPLVVRGRKVAPVAAVGVAVQRGEVGTVAVAGESAGAQRIKGSSIGRIKGSSTLTVCVSYRLFCYRFTA